ncbi:MAG: hypothetical protein KDI46_03530 [Alphaproteobacteria bacterium]|nr:hypothetical protein [Alphaproteobacteria bacterium]
MGISGGFNTSLYNIRTLDAVAAADFQGVVSYALTSHIVEALESGAPPAALMDALSTFARSNGPSARKPLRDICADAAWGGASTAPVFDKNGREQDPLFTLSPDSSLTERFQAACPAEVINHLRALAELPPLPDDTPPPPAAAA